MGFIEAGSLSRLDRFVGYFEPYATSHQTLDADEVFQEEVRNVVRGVALTIRDVRAGTRQMDNTRLKSPRPK